MLYKTEAECRQSVNRLNATWKHSQAPAWVVKTANGYECIAAWSLTQAEKFGEVI